MVLPAGAVAPSEATLIARAYLLQGQESRRDADELLNTSIATPDELKAFLGGRSDLTPGDILGAKVAQASAAELREQAKVASEQAKDARDKATKDSGELLRAAKKTSAAVNNLQQESAEASRLADITAKSLAAAQLAATTDSSEAVRQEEAVKKAEAAAAELSGIVLILSFEAHTWLGPNFSAIAATRGSWPALLAPYACKVLA